MAMQVLWIICEIEKNAIWRLSFSIDHNPIELNDFLNNCKRSQRITFYN